MNTYQALRVLNVKQDSSQETIKIAYRKLALKVHPDRNKDKKEDDAEFKKITEAYNHLKKNYNQPNSSTHNEDTKTKSETNFKRKPQWGAAPDDRKIPEQDWSKFTKEFEEGNPDFWKEYEKQFWEEYNTRIHPDNKNGEYEKAEEPKKQPNLFINVDESLCIGCCSCEVIAPSVFEINKKTQSNPKSSVINQKGAGVNKIMNAAQTCPTKAIRIEDISTKERLFPY